MEHGFRESVAPPNELKLSDGGWRCKTRNTEKTPPPASVRWSALLGDGMMPLRWINLKDLPRSDEPAIPDAEGDAGTDDRSKHLLGENAGTRLELFAPADERVGSVEEADGVEARYAIHLDGHGADAAGGKAEEAVRRATFRSREDAYPCAELWCSVHRWSVVA